jgi:hypothetical protein
MKVQAARIEARNAIDQYNDAIGDGEKMVPITAAKPYHMRRRDGLLHGK